MKQIFIHGLGQDASSWKKTISMLPYQNMIDCPNLATIVDGNQYTYENIYKAFSSYACQYKEPVSICGLSLGAVIALNFAVDNPEKVSALILIAPQYKMPKTLLRLQNIIFRFMPNSAFEKMGFDKETFIKLTQSMMNLDFSEGLKDIICPTLVLYGEKDRANRTSCETAARLIPNAEIKVIENSGHEINIDAPEKLSIAISSFFDNV
ncbi:MAG: alpha/beta hydrolase [Christensenellaceae bacterium]